MTRFTCATLAGSSLLMLASTLSAQAQTVSGSTSADEQNALEEIIVSARRREESVQDVPQAISVISSETLEKLDIFTFEDISKVVSGLSLTAAGNVTTVRGVSFNPVAQTTPTVAMYYNEAPLQSQFVFQSMFDIEQIEFLRGPQGTLRGQSAPSGAITITTRRPDLADFGGSISASATDLDGRNLQGAINLPIIQDKLAVRIAALMDETDNGGVESVNSSSDPSLKSDAYRVSVRFDPTDNLSVVAAYQNLQIESQSLGGAIYGNGAPGGTIPATITATSPYAVAYVQPVGVNGPAIPKGERLSVAENADRSETEQELASGQIDYTFLGQRLSYVGAWSHLIAPPAVSFGDTTNVVTGADWPSRSTKSDLTRRTNELRLSSEERIAGFLEYVVGVYNQNEDIENLVNNGVTFQTGAFGSPLGAPIAQSPNLRYSTTSFALVPTHYDEWSYFANLTAHLGDKAEVSAGVRYIDAEREGDRINTQTAGFAASRTLTQAQCAAQGGTFGATYANVCDVPRPATTATIPNTWQKSTTVYSASFSWHFTQDVMAYASFGTSWRPGPSQGSLINGRNDPVLASLSQLADEESESYEIGLKSAWLENRLRTNVAVYHQKFDNLVFSSFAAAPYLADTAVAPPTVTLQIPLNYNINAEVDGVDFDVSYLVTDNWSLSAGYSYADGKYTETVVPCQDGNFDGVPDTIFASVAAFQAAGVFIARCLSKEGPAAGVPDWNATLQTEYWHSITGSLDGFVRGLYTYYPSNPNADPLYEVPSYGLLNVYLGVRSPDGKWDLQLFAKNALDEQTITTLAVNQNTDTPNVSGTFGNSGYFGINYTPRREYGLSFRYGFGSR